jgi:hypothetical protein
MKFLLIAFLLAVFLGCNEVNENGAPAQTDTVSFLSPAEVYQYHLDTIQFTPVLLDTCHLKLSEIQIGGTTGGKETIWSICLNFYNTARYEMPNFFTFRFFDRDNDPDNFSKAGLHLETAVMSDGLQYSTFTLGPLSSDEIEYFIIVPLSKSDASHNFELQGKGFVRIKQPVYWKWPKRIWNGERYILPGDSLYLSFRHTVYYVPTTIYFDNKNEEDSSPDR